MEALALLKSSPAQEVVLRLQRHGTMSIKELGEALGVTRTAVRQQLAVLERMGLVERTLQRSGVGRPRGLYSLSEEGHRLFSREYEPLLRLVLEELEAKGGPREVKALLGRISRKMAEDFDAPPGESSLSERVADLAEQLTSKGHITEAETIPEGFSLRMYNCPYRELVADYPAICDMERSMIGQLLGSGVKRHQCILDERHTHCAYSVTGPEGSSPAAP